MKALQNKDDQRQLHHLTGGPGQQNARRQPRKRRNPKERWISRAFDGHDFKAYGARTFSIVLNDTLAYCLSASAPNRATSNRPVSITFGDAPFGTVRPNVFPACSSQRRKPSRATMEAAATATSASAQCIWITGTPLRREPINRRLSI